MGRVPWSSPWWTSWCLISRNQTTGSRRPWNWRIIEDRHDLCGLTTIMMQTRARSPTDPARGGVSEISSWLYHLSTIKKSSAILFNYIDCLFPENGFWVSISCELYGTAIACMHGATRASPNKLLTLHLFFSFSLVKTEYARLIWGQTHGARICKTSGTIVS